MIPIDFNTTTRILCEPNSLSTKLGKVVKDFGATQVLIVTDKALVQLGFVNLAIEALSAEGIQAIVFDGVIPDPTVEVVDNALNLARHHHCDAIVALGGGSSIDTAKIIALHDNAFVSATNLFNQDLSKFNKLPLIAIPTTAGTGAEVTFVSVITATDGNKFAVFHSKILPDVAILDANLTLGLPPLITAATALDAMVHCIEAYTSRTKKNPISDALAVKGLQLLWQNYRKVMTDGKNIEARSEMLLGSCLAGMAFVNASVAAVHGLSYPLSIRFHVPHGHANALVMAGVFTFNLPAAQQHYAELARAVLPKQTLSLDDTAAATLFIDELKQFLTESGLKTSLRELGIQQTDIDGLATLMINTYARLIVSNPIDMTVDDVKKIYQDVF
ncbi:iron-containing alcohol dehydrogenase [Moraxella osloensis]|nr:MULTISPECIES: iron-containing alcohol dehydrogenase [Pseudomonadota]QRO13132.1 iron-containing alcohol dehydrogenase [Moraxella osloensis]VXB12961.1 Alcohol dehydrogenase [Enhydrobacter sp. 8BJ]